ncbi:MAG: NAD-dependent epimerase/dehydratase family protein [Prolixibacteraceae bacterium]|jgi:nucleoside-diphosphate-sugar epimerase|nr:NAD-dependent epimerase/dehydratase family protein [Prolixibacteraceae bacterium]MBT6006834.1 NAD-dependent epimerase/dehydratase family protein [Prolixibacteraceae bacterium]MBT6764722.1 NAD-dependent epimerase/dehydratase family protein [Prolixibacteraceae bacterium]MBT6997292.1 NAD-dependent epimerase/dehydratase family protein [Prolixibacteraceae bacterium]MBT7394704.1 NAD-dependent epimerase/dehydratase family protein [Prolixibacteraceae bacterium]
MKTIIINGANGYVASNFINKLLTQKYKVIALVRPSIKFSPTERMKAALAESSDDEYVNSTNLKVYSYSLLHKDFLIPQEQLEDTFSEEVDYFHFAASLKFDFKSKEEIFETNVGGLGNSIQVFSKFAKFNSRFFFIGTAYSCGRFSGRFEEKFYPNDDIDKFRNYYEQSKRFAENVVKKQIDNHGLNGHVIRLSQVVGNNKTGVTKTDYGIFDFTKRIHSLAFRNPNQTVRVHVNPVSTQNLIPIDTVVNYLLRAVEVKHIPVIMNFIAKKQVKNIHIIKSISNLLPINIVPEKKFARHEMTALERIISAGMSFTESYIDTNLQFDTSNLDKILMVDGHEANENTVHKMLEYFIDNLATQKRKRVMVSGL